MEIVGLRTRVVECLRIAQLIERHGDLFLNRVFTSTEVVACSARAMATQHYASYWAGKEAVVGLLGGMRDGMRWKEIEIRRLPDGSYKVALASNLSTACDAAGIGEIKLDVSFCRTHATAVAIAVHDDED